jgi:hypothetical protein
VTSLTRKQGLLRRIHRLATPNPWNWEDRDTVVEVLETLVEEVFKDEPVVVNVKPWKDEK